MDFKKIIDKGKGLLDKGKDLLDKIIEPTKHHTLPGFGNLSIFEVGSFFVRGMTNGTIGIRAAAIAFNFFLAVFPANCGEDVALACLFLPAYINDIQKNTQSESHGRNCHEQDIC